MPVAQHPLFCFSYAFVRLKTLPLLAVQHASMINVLAAEMWQHIAGLSATKVGNCPEGESEAKSVMLCRTS